MNVIGHHAPREKKVADAIEMFQAIGDDLCGSMIAEIAFASVLIEKLLATFDQCCIKHSLLGNRNASPDSGDLVAGRVALRPKPLQDVRGQRIEEPPCDKV